MERVDVAVIGAGMAGLAAAHELAKDGKSVLVFEKGTYPGSKSVSGGRLYLNPVRALLPGLLEGEDVPFERFVSKELITLMKAGSAVTVALSSDAFGKSRRHSATVLRAKFDQWLAGKAEEAGALIAVKTKAEEVSRTKEGAVVKTGGDEVLASVVILAEGANPLIARSLGLSPPAEPRNFAVGVKEVVALPGETINERFNLEPGEGAAQLFVGSATRGMKGGGFLYTNSESLSLGLVVGVDAAMDGEAELPGLFDEFRSHPAVAPLVKGGKTVEYSAHTIPEGGFHGISKLYDDNLLVAGDAAGFALNMGFTVRGMDFALASGYYAARAAKGALKKGSFRRAALSKYETLLGDSFVLKDLRAYRNMPRFLDNPRLYGRYPEMACGAFERLMTFGAGPKEGIRDFMCAELRGLEYGSILRDLWGALRWL